MAFFKKWLLNRGLKKRRIQEYHLKADGCPACWPTEKHAKYFNKNPQIYMAMMSCFWACPPCPMKGKPNEATEIIESLAVK